MTSYINYFINLTEEEKAEIEKQVQKSRFELRVGLFLPSLPIPILPQVSFPSSPQQIVRNVTDRAESAVAKKLSGTKTVYYMRAGNKARLFFKYSDKENGAVEVIAESNKDNEQQVIDNLKQNYE